jgi:large subunit ribosomal protein L6
MSRIGKSPVTITSGVEVSIDANNLVTVGGPKGTLTQQVDSAIEVKIEEGEVVLSRSSDHKDHRAMHGLYRSLIFNMIEGVTIGYKKELELVGVGYRAKSSGQVLELALGKEVVITAETKKGSNPGIILESFDKQLIGQVAAKIKSLRKPEPYKGKGVRFKGEYIRRKAGKSASK